MLAAKDIPDLHFDMTEVKEKGESSERTNVMEIIDVETKRNMTVSQNSNFREHSKNLLESVAGGALQQANEQRSVEKRWTQKYTKGLANTENILETHGVVKK